eukprot:11224615-Alexandrium_andersonii.AAC.1
MRSPPARLPSRSPGSWAKRTSARRSSSGMRLGPWPRGSATSEAWPPCPPQPSGTWSRSGRATTTMTLPSSSRSSKTGALTHRPRLRPSRTPLRGARGRRAR